MQKSRIFPTLNLCLVIALSIWLSGCSSSHAEQPKPTPPAKVEHAVKEADLATIKLTPEAEKRLSIETAAIEYRDVERTLDAGGEVVAPEGQTMLVAAPLSGTLQPGPGGTPFIGQTVRKGQALFRLTPYLAPERDLRVQLERDITTLTERVNGIRQRKARAEILAQEKAGSVRALEEAQAELAVAEAEMKGARERLARFDQGALDSNFTVAITAPISGMIQKVNAGAGQAAVGGAPLVEIANLANIWIRVPVYVGDLQQVARRRPARVRNLNDAPGAPVLTAQPVNAPPSADPIAATADLYYGLPNGDKSLRPGQRVGVTLTLHEQEQSLVIPWSAVLHDIHGATWVYENTAPQTFVRRPVEVKRVSGSLALLGRGPRAGAKIVTAGAVELFGTEFGAGK